MPQTKRSTKKGKTTSKSKRDPKCDIPMTEDQKRVIAHIKQNPELYRNGIPVSRTSVLTDDDKRILQMILMNHVLHGQLQHDEADRFEAQVGHGLPVVRTMLPVRNGQDKSMHFRFYIGNSDNAMQTLASKMSDCSRHAQLDKDSKDMCPNCWHNVAKDMFYSMCEMGLGLIENLQHRLAETVVQGQLVVQDANMVKEYLARATDALVTLVQLANKEKKAGRADWVERVNGVYIILVRMINKLNEAVYDSAETLNEYRSQRLHL